MQDKVDNAEQDYDGFWELVSLTISQTSLLLFVTFDIMLRRHICLTQSCDFVIYQ